MKCRELIEILEELAPVSLACDWDNPGLLAGRSDKEVRTVYLALDATDDVIDNAVECRADMIITHHPLIFKPLKKVNDEDFISRRIPVSYTHLKTPGAGTGKNLSVISVRSTSGTGTGFYIASHSEG